MKLLLCKPRGFCAGVERAIETVEKALSLWGAPIYVKHEIVHNKHVVNSLKEKGAIFVEDIEEIPFGERVIYSAHGVSPTVRQAAKKRNLIEIDATCGLVTKVHSAAKRYAQKGYHIILIGHKDHVEIIGTYGEAPNSTTIVESVKEVSALQFSKDQKLFYLTQTTLSLDDVKSIIAALKEKFPSIETLPSSSICYATTNRQMALGHVIPQADLVLVIGDPTSSNSNRLCEVATSRGVEAFLINEACQLRKEMLTNKKTIVMTAGASTPEHIVQDCISKLKEWGIADVENVVYKIEDIVFSLPKEVLN